MSSPVCFHCLSLRFHWTFFDLSLPFFASPLLQVRRNRCEDCAVTRASFGMKEEGKSRWCMTCAKKNHLGATGVLVPKCEDCVEVRARHQRDGNMT